MKIISNCINGELRICLSGDLDHHAARIAIPEISRFIDRELPTILTLDFEKISFMDSSGIALVIGSFKRANLINASFSVINVPKQAYKVFHAAGLCKIVSINTQEKVLS